MSLTFKILDGTRKSGKSLCLSCAQMSRRLGQNNEDEIYCGSYKFETDLGGHNRVTYPVSECTEYRPFNQLGLKDMYEMAWIIEPRKRGAGFAPDGVTILNPDELVVTIRPPSKKKSDDDSED